MRVKNFPKNELDSQVKNIVGKYLDLNDYRLFYFGSRVSGNGDERSDIDIGIEGDQPIKGEIITQVKDDLEDLSTLYTIDLVDFKKISPAFSAVAKQYIEEIN